MIFFVNRSATRNFQRENFSGWGLSQPPRTQLSEYLYERGVEFFDSVLPAQSWEMLVERELPAKNYAMLPKLFGHNFDLRAKSSLGDFLICIK